MSTVMSRTKLTEEVLVGNCLHKVLLARIDCLVLAAKGLASGRHLNVGKPAAPRFFGPVHPLPAALNEGLSGNALESRVEAKALLVGQAQALLAHQGA